MKTSSPNAKDSPAQSPPENDHSQSRTWRRPLLLLTLLIIVLISARVFGLGDKFGALRDWLQGLGPWGPLVFVVIYIVAVVTAIPGSAITIAGGALFGSV